MKDHSLIRFLIDICLLFLFFFLLLSPLLLIMSIKIADLDLRSEIIREVAGTKTHN